MSIKDDALRLAALRALRAALDAEVESLTGQVEAQLRELGARTLDAKLPDGTVVATLSTVTGKDRPYVADPDAFLRWVKRAAPTEIVETVRPAFQRALIDRCVIDDAAEVVDSASGEFVDWMSVKPGVETMRLVSKPEQQAAIAQAWASGTLDVPTPALG